VSAVAVAVVDAVGADFDAGKLHYIDCSEAHCRYIAGGRQTVEGVEVELVVGWGERSLSCGALVQAQETAVAVRGKAAVVETC